MTIEMQWATLEALKCDYHGEKKVRVEDGVAEVAPVSAKRTSECEAAASTAVEG